MAKAGRTLTALAAEIERRAESKRDFIAPTAKLAVVVEDDKPMLAVRNGSTSAYPIQEYAHGQLAEYAGIPMAYYRRMMAEDPKLLAENVNRWFRDMADKRRMVRTLDGQVRALLSDGYRTLENEDLAEAILPALLEKDLLILSCEITDRKLYIKAVDRSIERDVPTGRMGDGQHTIFDTISPGIVVSNSEIGAGALAIERSVYTRACTNLALFGARSRRYHTGKRAELSDEVYALLTDETKQQTDRAIWMQTRDMVTAAFAEAEFEAAAMKLGKASAEKIEPEQVVEVVERVGRRYSLAEGERKGVLAALIAGGDLTRYGLSAAVTRFSQDDAVGYDRATELERAGGDIVDVDFKELVAG